MVSDGSYGPTRELCCEKMVRGGARAAARVAGLSPRSHAAPRGLANPPPHTHTHTAPTPGATCAPRVSVMRPAAAGAAALRFSRSS